MTKFEYKAIRISMGKTQQEMAAALDVSIDTIRNREQGRVPITKEMMLAAQQIKALAKNINV